MAGTLTISGQQTGTPEGSDTISLTISLGSVFEELPVALASGANTITVPTGATGVIVIPPVANTVALTLKGIAGDTGIPLSLTQPSVLTFPASPPASIVVNAASLMSASTTFRFF